MCDCAGSWTVYIVCMYVSMILMSLQFVQYHVDFGSLVKLYALVLILRKNLKIIELIAGTDAEQGLFVISTIKEISTVPRNKLQLQMLDKSDIVQDASYTEQRLRNFF